MTGDSAKLMETPAGVHLCPLEAIADPGARNFVLEVGGRLFHGFIVRAGGQVRGYVDRCPHLDLPLAKVLDDYLAPSGEWIACGWHGALFRIEDGQCVGGPCIGAHLRPWPVHVLNGAIETATSFRPHRQSRAENCPAHTSYQNLSHETEFKNV